jgi:hypothetical protein
MNKLSLLIFVMFLLPLGIFAHEDGHEEEEAKTTDRAEKAFEGGYALSLKLGAKEGKVGTLTAITAGLTKNGEAVKNVNMDIAFHHVEDKADNYRAQFFSADGSVTFNHQFFDGANHKIVLKVAPANGSGFEEMEMDMEIAVEGIQPPNSVLIKTIFILLGFTALFMALGYVASFKI